MAVSQNAMSVGETVINVDNAKGFKNGEEITLLDEENTEHLKITSVSGNKITVPAIKKASKKGALIVKSNMIIRGNKLDYDTWGNYDIRIREMI